MFIPKKSKFKKQQKGKLFNSIKSSNGFNGLHFGSVGLKAISFGRLSSKQVEAIKKAVNKQIKKWGRLIIHSFPSTPISRKPIAIRMGKGKGNVDHWVFKVRPGFTLCEIITSEISSAKKLLIALKKRLNIKARIITN